jgi:hypothetical protein
MQMQAQRTIQSLNFMTDFLCAMAIISIICVSVFLIVYYGMIIGDLLEDHNRYNKCYKNRKEFLIALIPFQRWGANLINAFKSLDKE